MPSLLLIALTLRATAGGILSAPQWCISQPVASLSSAPTDFRGTYRDFSLFVTDVFDLADSNCVPFGLEHHHGDDGLWVIELASEAAAKSAVQNATNAGVPVYLQRGLSIITGGGNRLPSILGFDACGADEGVSTIPVPSRALSEAFRPSAETQARWRDFSASAVADDDIAHALALVSASQLSHTVRTLQSFFSRNSYATKAESAQRYLMQSLTALGYTVTLDRFREDMSANVIAELPARRAEPSAPCIVVGGAHYDSRGANASDPTIRAPGADDNASGSAAMLEIARVLVRARIALTCAVRIVLFSGEEQGLLGSRALAARWAAAKEPIVAMVNADMLGYQIPDAPITLGFKDRYVTPELVALATSLVRTYVPDLQTGSSSSCCSDYMSFFENGFAAVGFFENTQAASSYPAYHTSEDRARYVNFAQLQLETRAVLATLLAVAR